MMKNKLVRLLFIGFIVWLVPFVTSFGFFDRTGKPIVNMDLFKSIMVVISSFTGGYAIVNYFRTIRQHFTQEALLAGITWLSINILLDLLILVPFAGMSYPAYFYGIGIRYLQIPIICAAAGMLLDRKLIVRQ